MYQINTSYTFNLRNVIYQLYLNKAVREYKKERERGKGDGKEIKKARPFSIRQDLVKYVILFLAASQTVLLEISSFTGTGQVTRDT